SYPGRPLRFLKNLLADRDRGETWSARDVVAAFARETGLPRFLLDDSVPLDLQASRDWFAGRVVGQARATDLIVELTAAVKTGLSRPGRPIASLLFIGPTGVGKTETAKALAEFFYQDKNRMARFDMSEYADPISVKQLVGGVFGSEGALTSKVREQPFGVVLLDEFEKAHPLFFDLLLQILGEGRLTDAGGRAADFSNSVIVMTSNLGAEQYMQGAAGFRKEDAAEAERATEHFLRRVREFLRPELFNRIDRVVPFLPLDQDAVLNIARRELELVQQRDGLRYREVELEFGPEVAAVLAKAGHDPRYGARPLKRAMERSLLGPLAEGLNHYAARLPLAAQVETQGPSLTVQVRARPASDSRSVRRREELSRLAATKQCVQLRRDAQALEHCPAAVEVRNDVFRLERMKQKLERKGNHKAWQDPALAARLATLPQLQAMAKRLNSFRDDCFRLEDDVLLAFHEQQDGNGDGKATSEGQDDAALATSEWERLTRERQNLILDLYALQYEDADRAVLVAYSEHPTWMFTLAKAYYWIAGATGATAKLFALKPYRKGLVPPPSYVLPPPPDDEGKRKSRTASKIDAREGDPRGNDPRDDSSEDDPSAKRAGKDKTKITRLDAFYVKDPERYLEQPRDGVVGVALVVEGELAFPRLEPEQGLHVFQVNGKAQRCRVQVSRAKLEDYQPPPGVDRKGGIPDGDPRRVLHPELRKAEDPILRENNLSWAAGEFHEMLADLVQERLLIEAKSLIQL
ncbi:MAG: AAA family ATPase, partial [Planctomycetales bacterium]